MWRIVLFGAAWIAILAAFGLAVGLSGRPGVTVEVRTSLGPPAPPPRAGQRYPGWTVTRAYSAHQMMVVEVEAERPDTARQIATQIVEPLKDRYDEVLIYVRKPGTPPEELPSRRIQWTPAGGYIETIYPAR